MINEQTILHCEDIHKSFSLNENGGSQLDVLRGIDFEVTEGEMIAVVGASGSGKSTFLHILGGLDRPTKGNVYWQGKNISTVTEETLATLRGMHAGFVFQFHHLLPEFTALENVMIPLMIHRVNNHEAELRAQEILATVGLSERLMHKPGELSGGEQQRVAVARALANNPKIIFADEPTGNLDSVQSHAIHQLLIELNTLRKQTLVIVTHNETFAAQAHRIFRMQDGKLLPQEKNL